MSAQTKIVSILDLSDIEDKKTENTLLYYFENNADNFYPFPIIYTDGTPENVISTLNETYAQGYRFFLGSSIFNKKNVQPLVVEWFNNHFEAEGFALNTIVFEDQTPNRIYSLFPTFKNSFYLFYYIVINRCEILCFIYDSLTVSQKEIDFLKAYTLSAGKEFVEYPIKGEEETTKEKIDSIFTEIPYNELGGIKSNVYVAMGELTNQFYNLFDMNTPYKQLPIFNQVLQPTLVSEGAIEYFNQNPRSRLGAGLITPDLSNLGSSVLWRDGYYDLGLENYSTRTLDAMIMVYARDSKKSVLNLGSHANSLTFDLITRNSSSSSVLYNRYVYSEYTSFIIGFFDNTNTPYIYFYPTSSFGPTIQNPGIGNDINKLPGPSPF